MSEKGIRTAVLRREDNALSGVYRASREEAALSVAEGEDGMVVTGARPGATEVFIPDRIGGQAVVAIGELAFRGQEGLRRVSLPEGMRRIGRSAFQGCMGLVEVRLPKIMDEIGESAFQGCVALKSLKLPEGLSAIPARSFYGCASLIWVDIPEGVVQIGERAFAECRALEEVMLPEGLVRIEPLAFSGCAALRDLRIPASVAELSATALPKSTLGEGQLYLRPQAMLVRAVAKRAYALPEGTRILAGWALSGNETLLNVDFGETLEHIGAYALANCAGLKEALLPPTVRRVDRGAFSECRRLSKVRLSPRMREIAGETFLHCTSLTEAELLPGIETVGERAFEDCRALKAILLPEGVHSVGERAFYQCASLERLELPGTLTRLGAGAISGCGKLRVLVLRGRCCDGLLSVLSEARRALVIAPNQPPEAFPGLWRKRVCLGYALARAEGIPYDNQATRACVDWMRRHGSAFISEALADKALLHLLVDEECLSLRDVQSLLERADGADRDEYYMTLLDYRNRRFGSESAQSLTLW